MGVVQCAVWGDQGRETAAATLGVCGGRVGGGVRWCTPWKVAAPWRCRV